MTDERRASRKQPIKVSIDRGNRSINFEARGLPWRKRNDFGDEIVTQYYTALNKAIEVRKEGIVSQLMESVIDYEKLFKMAYPEGSSEDFDDLEFPEIIEVLGAALEVNALERQIYMLDPNRPAPIQVSGQNVGASEDGQRTTSLEDLSSAESVPVET